VDDVGNQPLVLCKKQWITAKEDTRLFIGLSLLMLAFVIVALISIFPAVNWADLPWGKLPDKLSRGFAASPEQIVILIFIPAYLTFINRAKKYERLILSPEGIRYISPMPEFFKRWLPDWSLAWSEIKAIELRPSKLAGGSATMATLALAHGTGERTICPLLWADPQTYIAPRKMVFTLSLSFSRPPVVSAEKDIPASEVMRYLRQYRPDIPVASKLNDSSQRPIDLEKDPHGKVGILLIFLLIAYAIIDLFIGPESYIDQPPHLFYFASGLLAALLAGIWLSRSKLHLAEKIGLALLIGMVTSVTMLPGTLRINALLNNAEVHEYRVIRSGNGILLQPLDEGIPHIVYFADNDYWARYGKDDTYPVKIRKGILGGYQFDVASITDEIHRFHAGKPAGN